VRELLTVDVLVQIVKQVSMGILSVASPTTLSSIKCAAYPCRIARVIG